MSELTLSARDLVIVQKVFQCFKSPDALKVSQGQPPPVTFFFTALLVQRTVLHVLRWSLT